MVGRVLFGDAVFLQLEIEPVAEDRLEFRGLLPGPVHVVLGDQPGDLAVQAGGEGDQPSLWCLQDLHVDAGLVVKALELGDGGQFHQVLVAVDVHGQEDDDESLCCRRSAFLSVPVAGAM